VARLQRGRTSSAAASTVTVLDVRDISRSHSGSAMSRKTGYGEGTWMGRHLMQTKIRNVVPGVLRTRLACATPPSRWRSNCWRSEIAQLP